MRQVRQVRLVRLVRQVRQARLAYYRNPLMENWMNKGKLSVHHERKIHWKPLPIKKLSCFINKTMSYFCQQNDLASSYCLCPFL